MTTSAYTVSKNDGTFGAIGTWSVWLTDKMVRLSSHETEREAKAAVKRYEAADARRERQK